MSIPFHYDKWQANTVPHAETSSALVAKRQCWDKYHVWSI